MHVRFVRMASGREPSSHDAGLRLAVTAASHSRARFRGDPDRTDLILVRGDSRDCGISFGS
jgi:hypothetical protein